MNNELFSAKLLKILQRYEVTELYTNQKKPHWCPDSFLSGIAISHNFTRIYDFVHFIHDIAQLSPHMEIKPAVPHEFCNFDSFVEKECLECCYTSELGWI